MNRAAAILKLRDVIRRKHLALSTEESYAGWLMRYTGYIAKVKGQFSSEQKMEMFLSALAKSGVSASTQNQAFNAILFFYREVLGQQIGLVRDTHGYPTRLVVRMLYGCGLHEANVQRCVKAAARQHGLCITPHYLRHAFATHALRQGANVRDVQDALGHAQLNTTMGYLAADQRGVNSPLDVMEVA